MKRKKYCLHNENDLVRKQYNDYVHVRAIDLLDLIHWSRRYCDQRATYAPSSFNQLYDRIKSEYSELLDSKDEFDHTLKDKGTYWPYAQDGMHNTSTGAYDARPKKPTEVSNEGENTK